MQETPSPRDFPLHVKLARNRLRPGDPDRGGHVPSSTRMLIPRALKLENSGPGNRRRGPHVALKFSAGAR